MNYSIYKLTPKEILRFFLTYELLSGVVSFLFYDSLTAFLILLPFGTVYFGRKRKELMLRRKKELKREFKDMILAVSNAVSAGYSIENSFREAYRDVVEIYGETCLICKEMRHFFRRMEIGVSLEKILRDFAARSGVGEIRDFSEIFLIAKRNGGDFSELFQKTASILNGQDETEREIEVILSGKRYEQKIMGVIPLVIILYLRFSTGGFIDVLYHNITGVVVMTVCLAIYLVSFLLAEKITSITV